MNPLEEETGAADPASGHDAPLSSAHASGLKVMNLALQGGGTHGAFGWGVLDRLLEDQRLSFEAITASSAGAVNAAVLAAGFGGRWTRRCAAGAGCILA